MKTQTSVKQSGTAVVAAGAAARPVGGAKPTAVAAFPKIKLGSLEVSRLILGSNPFFGHAHKPGNVSELMRAYFTDDRIMATMDEAADLGITAVAVSPHKRWLDIFSRYTDRGGKLRIWLSQPDGPAEGMKDEIALSVRSGARGIFFQGHRVEERVDAGEFSTVVRGWVEHAKSFGVPVGVASHRPDVHLEAERLGFPTDFYWQCFYNVSLEERYLEDDRQKAVATLRQLAKPVIGYKILGAGRNEPIEAFEFAFRHLRPKDGVCAGVFPVDQPGQLAQNAALVRRLSAK